MAGFAIRRAQPYPLSVVRAGAYVAWNTRKTAGIPAGTTLSPASGISGTGISKGSPNIDVNGGTNSFTAVDFGNWNTFVYGGAVLNLTNCSFSAGAANAGTGFGFLYQGVDSGITPGGVSTVTLSHCNMDGTGYRQGSNQIMNMVGASFLTVTDSRFIRAPQDYFKCDNFGSLTWTRNYTTSSGCYTSAGDHTEMLQPFGVSVTLTDSFFDGASLVSPNFGITALVYLDPAGAGVVQTAVIDRCIFTHDGTYLYVLQFGGTLGTLTVTLQNCVLQVGTGGHYISGWNDPSVTFIDGGNNRDYATGALITAY